MYNKHVSKSISYEDIYMQVNPIILPSWFSSKTVFQQGVPLKIEGTAAASATITLEVVKDPTDGRRVSKLDNEYGVILSLETTTSGKGKFSFTIPAYKASSDAFTFIFKCFDESVTLNDVRCGDVWLFLGSEILAIPIKNANAPSAPLKRQVLNFLHFYTPARDGIESEENEISYEGKTHFHDAHWIKITETKALAEVSSAAFSFAYSLADQIHYPVGVVDLSCDNCTIINWLSEKSIQNLVAVSDYLKSLGLYISESAYAELLSSDRAKVEAVKISNEIKEERKEMDFDLSKVDKLKQLKGQDTEEAALELDFPNSSKSSEKKDTPEVLTSNAAKALDFKMITKANPPENSLDPKVPEAVIRTEFRMSTLYKAKLMPMSGMTIRGMVYSPSGKEKVFDRYDLLMMAFLETLSDTFEPKMVEDDSLMPSLIGLALHPDSVDLDDPYTVLEFNETVAAFLRRLNMPTGIVSYHDLLLPDKTKSFTVGKRLAVSALGIHFSAKLPKASPQCIGIERAGNKLILSFDNLGDGLRLSEDENILRGFAVCGEDRFFYPAQARILHGVRVMVWRDEIAEPVSVTYGFKPIPHDATFKNLSDLPVLPFRFDREPAFFSPDLSFGNCDNLEFTGKAEKDSEFKRLKIFKNFKGNSVITNDYLNKTEGNASLYIKYETENSKFGFEPDLSYASLNAPIEIYGKHSISVDVFNPEQKKKKLRIEGFYGEADIHQQLTWQTITFAYSSEGPIILDKLRFTIEDSARNGEIYFDNIRFI